MLHFLTTLIKSRSQAGPSQNAATLTGHCSVVLLLLRDAPHMWRGVTPLDAPPEMVACWTERVLEVKGPIQMLGLVTPDRHSAEEAPSSQRLFGCRGCWDQVFKLRRKTASLFGRCTAARVIFGRQSLIPHFYSPISSWTLQAWRTNPVLLRWLKVLFAVSCLSPPCAVQPPLKHQCRRAWHSSVVLLDPLLPQSILWKVLD